MNSTENLIAQLRDIHTPEVSGLPAPGWWIVAIAVLLVAVAVYFQVRRHQRKGWQREARAELHRLRSQMGAATVSESLSGVSRLVRRVALAARPRANVASLQGDAWLAALDDICGKSLFSNGFGQLLEQAPYQPAPQLSDNDLEALMDVVAQLIDAAEVGGSPSAIAPGVTTRKVST